MNILYVDDERSAHTIFRHSLGPYEAISQVSYLFDYEEAIAYAKGHRIDCAFLDISLLNKDGITLAKDLRCLQPEIEFVFITGFDEFARAAYQVGGRAYLTKPYNQEALQEALALMQRLTQPWVQSNHRTLSPQPHIFAKTFGNFDLLLDGVPVHFKHTKAKELLAFLIHHMGGTVSNTQVFYALWNHQAYTRDNSTYVRRTIRALRDELTALGIEDILVSTRNSTRIDMKKLTCDTYELLNGSTQVAGSFCGTYMSQYTWSATSVPMLKRAVASASSTHTI